MLGSLAWEPCQYSADENELSGSVRHLGLCDSADTSVKVPSTAAVVISPKPGPAAGRVHEGPSC
jgi:hypothetical protein